ncbi:MAG: carbohydrate-binding family 9-like protein [Candidatus Omnitrophica bacterium]|nr:carbohydrate-binding family 9-like protein [Candidatus Omnitrophota bacterium]MCM8769943.1 carbohydrate-binding family 9-like protein [Candidatus Omnitrophota bacterium]
MKPTIVPCQSITGEVKDFTTRPPGPYPSSSQLPLLRFWDKDSKWPKEKGFSWCGYDQEGLRFAVVFEDSDIITQATANNQKLWMLGDTVEFFVKPGEQEKVYYEIHISANGYLMDLRFPSREEFRSKVISWEQVLAYESGSRYRTVDLKGGWAAEIIIPWKGFGLSQFPPPGTVWQFAICRYNYSSSLPEPEISSTAYFSKPDFHRYEEYHDLVFI